LANGNSSDLTYNQEILVALIATEQIKMQVKLAGGEIKDRRPRRAIKSKDKDPYGEILERNKRMKEMTEKIKTDPEMLEKYTRPL
jgi:hypothetical protein